jgi:hypothetical protein
MRVEVNEEVVLLGGPCHGQTWRSPNEDIPDWIQQDDRAHLHARGRRRGRARLRKDGLVTDSRGLAYWLPLGKQKRFRAQIGKVVVPGGAVLAQGVTLAEARERLEATYRILADKGASDVLDRRLPGSYGSNQ